ncbi:hypothetical protein Lser_V15G06068 [Lactuca serriola]
MSGLPHYKSSNDKLILITESFHSQLGVRLLHRTDDYECDSSTTPMIASRLTSLTATLIGESDRLLNLFDIEEQCVEFLCHVRFISTRSQAGVAMLDISNYGRRVDHHRDMSMDIDHMSYEELLALGEQIGNAGSGLSKDFISGYLKTRVFMSSKLEVVSSADQELSFCTICQVQSSSSTQELVPFFSETQEAVYTNSNRKVPKTEGGNNNMMIRVAAETQQGGVAAIDHGEMPNNFGGNKSLYNDRVESFAAVAGEEGHNSKSGGGGKKKGKKGRQIDLDLLGFKVTSNRIMMGEIQHIQD